MLLTDKTAIIKANEIIKQSGGKATISDYFWIHAEEKKDDVFCYATKSEDSNTEYPPGFLYPLFKRNGELTDFVMPLPV